MIFRIYSFLNGFVNRLFKRKFSINSKFHVLKEIWSATINGYSCIFFNNSKLFAYGLLLVTLFNYYAGLSGLFAALTCALFAYTLGFDRLQLSKGFYTFNAVLTGIGMGTFFDPSFVFIVLLLLASLINLILSITLGGWLGKYGLPYLSIPFVLSFWFIYLSSSYFEHLGLTHRNIYWLNELYGAGGNFLLNLYQSIDNFSIHTLVDTYFRSLSSVVFQNNILSGFLISLLLFLRSPIAFSLSLLGYFTAYFFAGFTGSELAAITYYNIGANYIMISIAIGGYFLIPSWRSYLWSIILIPVLFIILLFSTKISYIVGLPVFSLPFSLLSILFLYFLMLRQKANKLYLTTIQYYSAEDNLHSFNNSNSRLSHLLYAPLQLPFWGEWQVSQAYDGEYTHKGEWGKALDFTIVGDDGKSYFNQGLVCTDYYCYNKAVLAPANGVVVKVIDKIADNPIGEVDTVNNWGNSILIHHGNSLYTQLSHLKQASFKVKEGDWVKQGDILATCGNSGRSPEPHLHFQVQTSPIIGAKPLAYPFSYYLTDNRLHEYCTPQKEDLLQAFGAQTFMLKAFTIPPNSILRFEYKISDSEPQNEEWEAFTNAYNQTYLYCRTTNSTAYYYNDGTMFRFTNFYGNRSTLLYYFFLSAYKISLNISKDSPVDYIPLNILNKNKLLIWLNNFIAPFHSFLKAEYRTCLLQTDDDFNPSAISIQSKISIRFYNKTKINSESCIYIENQFVSGFHYRDNKLQIHAKCLEQLL